MRWRFSTLEFILALLVVAGSGVAYAWVVYGDGALIGATYAVFICMPVLAFERRIIFRRLYRKIHSLPTPGFLLSSVAVYFTIENFGFAAAGMALKLTGVLQQDWSDALVPSFNALIYALVVSGPIIFLLRVRELLGRDVFLSLLTGHYRKPIQEERVFLFVDLVGSTSFAERFGDLKTQEFLGKLFATMADPVLRYRGTIDDYVGDSAIISWPFARAVADAACIRCIFDILDEVEADAARWKKDYGEVPRLRAAIHGGTIVAAEIGVDKHKITYFGDTVNTTSRLEGLCRSLDRQVLISADLLRRIRLPEFIREEDLGEHEIKGRGQRLGVLALHRGRLTGHGSRRDGQVFDAPQRPLRA
ncbi:adenylate/guanylate cyclase domain-containing protein [Sinorhizobium alkalisoli]|uniref:Adenylate cyclase n=1 Tax=Sinorhizobium alkalisoli TaxID=1752398 RepID=A0A1E3V6P9_9HYPH|nr:adenylate/guanylate cyclase domain-containing protein [Sinorhizobium alkalisoli]MCA1489990.1 adenylate/guanylate cyclase domain-containing protein [Ensifer sp. NBAIM29]MCG5478082.1 adenylate/guanylate cyclase domain-containing protein [Sinorhizobium alkalisoli]ODR89240.1 adenylate cyclase [Sinorhizobium alkalisoli]QFI65694.1 Adenylate cyclase [Sinorhizobium alkalisoli]